MAKKEMYNVEIVVRSSQTILYNFLSTPSGLSEWFCDNVNIKGNIYTFIWDGAGEEAKLLSKKLNDHIKFRWIEDEEEGENYFFEFRIKIDDLTKDRILIITDFAEEDDIEDAMNLWSSQVNDLMHKIGA